MADKDYPVDYFCSFTEPWGEEKFESGRCVDRAAALQKAKADLEKYPYVDCVEFKDDELKMTFVPDFPDLRCGTITVSWGEDSWTEHVDDFGDVPLGQIDHADKQTCMDCYRKIAPIIRKHYGTFNVLDQQFLFWSEQYQKENEKEKKEMTERIFNGNDHWLNFTDIINQMKHSDVYHMSVAYLLALDTVTRNHVPEIFDFEEDCIKLEGLDKPWQTGTSRKTTRLAFNLWNGCCTDGETYTDEEGYSRDLPSRHFAVDDIFNCEYAPYYWQALKIRFPESCGKSE